MSWQWFHRLGSPRWFYQNSARWLPLAVPDRGSWFCSADWSGGWQLPQRTPSRAIVFELSISHVPASFLALAGYYIMAICRCRGPDLENETLLYGDEIRRANWCRADIYRPVYRRYLGQAHLGNLLGLGCAHHLHVNSAVFVSRRDGPAVRLSQHRCCQ